MLKHLLPWKNKKKELKSYKDGDIFSDFHRQFNALFDPFFDETRSGFGLPSLGKKENSWFQTPAVDFSENNKEIKVEANLPGLDEKDIKINLDGDRLIIEGEKSEEKEDKEKKYFVAERRIGKFQRIIPVPEGRVDKDKLKAELKKGVLKITLPKIPGKEQSGKKIQITAHK
jgi:HSP20 family protein